MKIIKSTIFYLLICVSVINANNCKNFLTMEGDGQQMSIMLCMNTNFPQSSVISKTNLSNSVIYNQTQSINHTASTNITAPDNNLFNTTNNNSNIPFVESATTPNIMNTSSITTPSSTTSSITTPSSTTSSITTPSVSPSTTTMHPISEPPILDTSTNLRGVNSSQNTTNNYKLQKKQQSDDETTLEGGLIAVIVLCSCITLFSVVVLIVVLCNHKKCCKNKDTEKDETNDDIEAQESLKKPKGRRVSPTNEKIEQFQYTNTYRNSQKLKRGTNTLKAVERLKHFRENREHKNGNRGSYPTVPPGMNKLSSNKLPNLPGHRPPNLPPPAPNTAMKQAHKIMERKNRNSWSIKEIPTNANGLSQKSTEVETDKILKTKGSHNLGLSNQ